MGKYKKIAKIQGETLTFNNNTYPLVFRGDSEIVLKLQKNVTLIGEITSTPQINWIMTDKKGEKQGKIQMKWAHQSV